MNSNEISQCSLFDYNSFTKSCRLFIYGFITSSLSISSRVGFVKSSVDHYFKYNQKCTNNPTEINRYLICGSNFRYECPSGLSWNGTMCTGIDQQFSFQRQRYLFSFLSFILKKWSTIKFKFFIISWLVIVLEWYV